MTSAGTSRYWFPARRYGWGWGIPIAWQGWVVILAYLALVLGGIPFVQVSKGSVVYSAYVVGLTAVLIVICGMKGEPPRGRWGGRDV